MQTKTVCVIHLCVWKISPSTEAVMHVTQLIIGLNLTTHRQPYYSINHLSYIINSLLFGSGWQTEY